MLDRFMQYIAAQHLVPPGSKVLLAVSGGRDSVCMAHLFHCARIPFAIAHCNFNLRPGDCVRDQDFVRQLAEEYGVEIIYYNDIDKGYKRINMTILHEIGHCVLDHTGHSEKEEAEGLVSMRQQGGGEQATMTIQEFIDKVNAEVKEQTKNF